MGRSWWRVPALASGLLVAGVGAATAAPPSTPPADPTTTTIAVTTTAAVTNPAPSATVGLELSTTRPARYASVTATLTGCTPGGVVRFWHHAISTEEPGTTHEGELELYEITVATCGEDGRAAATFVAGPKAWEDPSRVITGGVVAVTFGEDSSVPVVQARFQIAQTAGPGTPTTRPGSTGRLPSTGHDRTGTTAIAATLMLGAGLTLVLATRRRPPS